MEVTKWLKPSVWLVCHIGDGASVRAANASERRASSEKVDVQADPTATSGKADTAGRDERRRRPVAAPGYWRQQHVHEESARNTGKPQSVVRLGMTEINRTPARERPGALGWRRGSVVPRKPGNSGRREGTSVQDRRGTWRRTWRLGNLSTPHDVQKLPDGAARERPRVRSCPESRMREIWHVRFDERVWKRELRLSQ